MKLIFPQSPDNMDFMDKEPYINQANFFFVNYLSYAPISYIKQFSPANDPKIICDPMTFSITSLQLLKKNESPGYAKD